MSIVRRIEWFPCTVSAGVLSSQLLDQGWPWAEDRLCRLQDQQRIDAAMLWMALGWKVQTGLGATWDGKIPLTVATDGRKEQDARLKALTDTLPAFIDRMQTVRGLPMLNYCGSPRYTYDLMLARDMARNGSRSASAYSSLCIANMRPYGGSQIALDAMSGADPSWTTELDLLAWKTGKPPALEGWPDLTLTHLQRYGAMFMWRDSQTPRALRNPVSSIAAAPYPEKIVLMRGDPDALGRNRLELARELMGMGVSVCMDW